MKMLHIYWFLFAWILVAVPGCVATRNWVSEQLSPLAGRISNTEGQMGQFGERLSGAEGRLGQVDAKAEEALSSLGNLRLERRFVLDLREGANFAFNATSLTDQAKREIDAFFSDLKGDVEEMHSAVFLVAGHTDSIGSEDYNYELGRKRAESVARYLIAHKKMDPLRVIPVSYGKSSPLADNANREGRSKNRRVEILVYKEAIATAASNGAAGPRAGAKVSDGSDTGFRTR
ncbi:MAG: OmpA family protein [Deltaproteobacteria bacterium]|nr:OmpA family protein [Deltaproteobacteria bacterium]